MKRFALSVGAVSFTSLGLLFAPACSTDDSTSEDGTGGAVSSGGNTYLQGGSSNRGGSTGSGGASNKGGATATGGATTLGGSTGKGGTSATGGNVTAGTSSNAGNAGKGGTATIGGASGAGAAGAQTTGGVNTAGNAGKANNAGTTNGAGAHSGGSGGSAGAAGTTVAGTAGAAGAGTAGSGPACATSATSLSKFCAPPTSLALPIQSGRIGNYEFASSGTAVRIFNTNTTVFPTPADGDFFAGSPYTDTNCAGAGVNAAGRTGMTVTVTNRLSAPVDVLLYVVDQAGATAPYTIVTLTGRQTIAANATNVVVQLPFTGTSAAFVATCSYSSAIPLNPATIRQVGIGFDSSSNQVDVDLLTMSFY